MSKRVAPPCQTDVRSRPTLCDLGEHTREGCARLRLPAFKLRTERIVSVIEHRVNLRCIAECDNQLELIRAKCPQLFDRRGDSWLRNLGLSDPTEPLAKQCLDCLDPGSVIGDRYLLPKPVATLRTRCRSPRSVASCWSRLRGGRSESSRALPSPSGARASRTADGDFDVLALGWSGSDSASTRSRCLGLRCFVWSPLTTASLPS